MPKGVTLEDWLDRKAAADFLHVTEWWLEKHTADGVAPPYTHHSRKVWYRREDLVAWLAAEAKTSHVRQAIGLSPKAARKLAVRRADPPPPDPSKLEAIYKAQHGQPDVVFSRDEWEAFKSTLTLTQRQILRNAR